MASREELQTVLEKMLGSKNVYYQTPESTKLSYPAIVYSKAKLDTRRANGKVYQLNTRYDLMVIDHRPDHPVIKKLLTELPHCSYDRLFVSDNLYHDSLTLYY